MLLLWMLWSRKQTRRRRSRKKILRFFSRCRPGRRLPCLACSLQAHRPRRRQSSGQWSLSKFQKQAIYFCLSNRARIWAFFGESAHEAARPPKSIWGCPPRLRLWAVQAAFKRALAGPAAPILAWTRAWLFLKKLKCVFETKSNGSLDIRALAAQRPPTRRPTIAGAHRRPDTRPKEPFLGLKRRETKRKSCPIVPNQKWPRSSVSGSVVNGWKGRF